MARCEAVGKVEGRPNFGQPCKRNAIKGARFCVMHGGRDEVPFVARGMQDRPPPRLCIRRRRNGEQCKRYATPGANLCIKHGSSSPQIRQKARMRLDDMIERSLAELQDILTKEGTSDADRLRAIITVLDRTGHGPSKNVEMDLTVKPWEDVLQGIIRTRPVESIDAEVVEDGAEALEDENDPPVRRPTAPLAIEPLRAPERVGSAEPPGGSL